MARSTYIYVITLDDDIVAPFTVKHEAQSWLRKQDYTFGVIDQYYDGRGLFVRDWSPAEFLQ